MFYKGRTTAPNNLTGVGLYGFGGLSLAGNSYGFIFNLDLSYSGASGSIIQFLVGWDTQKIYIRRKVGGTWEEFTEI